MRKLKKKSAGLSTVDGASLDRITGGRYFGQPQRYSAAQVEEAKSACGSDAQQMCAPSAIQAAQQGDLGPVRSCLVGKAARISPACRAFGVKYGLLP